MKIDEAIVLESFDSHYNVRAVGETQFWFDTDEGEKYVINFEGKGTFDQPVDISFHLFDTTNNKTLRRVDDSLPSNMRYAMKIFSTVFHVAKQYIDKHDPEVFYFSGRKELARSYEMMVKKHSSRFMDYEMIQHQQGNSMYFIFKKKGL